MPYKLSFLIPANTEEFLKNTVEDILANTSDETEVIVGLDGKWSNPPLIQHPRVSIIYSPETIGQRKMTNLCAKLSRAKYVCKVDAHTSYDKDFDKKMIEEFEKVGDNVVMVPIMRNLHVYDWKCYKCGYKVYQDVKPICPGCGTAMKKKMLWEPRRGTRSVAYCFDSEPHFQYDNGYKTKKGYEKGIIIGYDLFFDRHSFATTNLLADSGTSSLTGSQPTSFSSIINLLTDFARSHHLPIDSNWSWRRQDMSINTMSLSSINSSGGIGTQKVLSIGDEFKVSGVATSSVFTKMVDDGYVLTSSPRNFGNEPSIDKSMCHFSLPEIGQVSIAGSIKSPLPIPTSGNIINSDVIKKLNDKIGGRFIYNEKSGSFHNGSVALIPIYDKSITESMSIQGSFYMMTREKYMAMSESREELGSWGGEGIEIACRFWLSGGKVLINHKTHYSHCFRTKGDVFGFPYPQSGREVQKTKQRVKDLFWKKQFKHQIYPVSWLIKRFWKVPGWEQKDLDTLKEQEKLIFT